MSFLRRGKEPKERRGEFSPTADELEFVQPFLDNRKIPFVDARAMIEENQLIPEDRRLALSDWLRDERSRIPGTGGERVSFLP